MRGTAEVRVRYISPDPVLMPGKDALDFIRKADTGCSVADAIDQLRRAIVARAVGATIVIPVVRARLKDMKPVPIAMGSSAMQPHSWSQPSRAMWQRAKIRSDGSVQFDLKGPWLPFAVIRSNVQREWGAPPSYRRQGVKARPIDDGIREGEVLRCTERRRGMERPAGRLDHLVDRSLRCGRKPGLGHLPPVDWADVTSARIDLPLL